RQDFDAARDDAAAFVVYHLLTIVAAVASRGSAFLWPAFAVATLVAVVMHFDLAGRWGLSRLLPKGPSQNIIARHVPKARRGERLKRVIVVAHYDSAKASLMYRPSMVKRRAASLFVTRLAAALVPVLILLGRMPFASGWSPYTWYATLVPAAYLLLPFVVSVHQQLLAHATDGANDNASGVAALLGIIQRVVPEPDTLRLGSSGPVRRTPDVAREADVVIEDALLTYTPVVADIDEPQRRSIGTFDDVEWDDDFPRASDRTGSEIRTKALWADEEDEEPSFGQASFDDELAPEPSEEHRGRREERRGVSDWLGLGKGFDARREGRRIGSWDDFGEEEDDFGFKGGSAGGADPFEEPDFAAQEAARIRRRVTSSVDRALVEKEIWFVATGAKESGCWGMRAFLSQYEEEARHALIINLDSVGVGKLGWTTSEGIVRRYHSDRRLASSARRVARDEDLAVRPAENTKTMTDAGFALARRFKALTFTAFDINGRVPYQHTYEDTVEVVSEESLELAADFVAKVIRDL
ncbi:MAG: M28 family peptidase, partial [Coriobacteriales bacterium]